MKSTGIVRNLDSLGRIVIPKELRDTMRINQFSPMEIFTEGDSIILRPYKRGCAVCGEERGIVTIGNTSICPGCIDDFHIRVGL